MSNETEPMDQSGVPNNSLSTPLVPQNSVSNDNSSNTESNDIHDIRDGVNNIELNHTNSDNSAVNTPANSVVNNPVNIPANSAVNSEVLVNSNQRSNLPIRGNRPPFRMNNTPYNDGMTRETRREYCREHGIPFRQYCRERLLSNSLLPPKPATVRKEDKAPKQPVRQPIQANYPQLPPM